MKRNIFSRIYLGRLQDRTDEFIHNVTDTPRVRPECFRWFCGMNDLSATYICQAL
ncbi:MAG: hypothetical protein IJ234_01440 [Clostridia bacterium]|nr:hypothetical protein [Clostridia bacterium]